MAEACCTPPPTMSVRAHHERLAHLRPDAVAPAVPTRRSGPRIHSPSWFMGAQDALHLEPGLDSGKWRRSVAHIVALATHAHAHSPPSIVCLVTQAQSVQRPPFKTRIELGLTPATTLGLLSLQSPSGITTGDRSPGE